MLKSIPYSIAASMLLVIACTKTEQAPEESTSADADKLISIYVVNYPLHYFAERIGGEYVDVRLPAPGDVDPAFWLPEPGDIAGFQKADLIVLNGAAYAKWISRATLPDKALVDTSSLFSDELITIDSAVTHTHGPQGDHSHGDMAFTTWLDPTLALRQASAIRDALVELRPEQEEAFSESYQSLLNDLISLDEQTKQIAKGIGDRPLLFSHPVYQYFIRRYNLNGVELHWEPDQMPTDTMWRDLESLLAEHPARWMIWEAEPEPAVVARLSASGIKSIVFDPVGNVPASGDYLSVIRDNTRNLESIPGKEPS